MRELGIRLQQNKEWAKRPKPKSITRTAGVADRNDVLAKQRLMNDLTLLALQTDSTRVIAYSLGGMNAVPSNIPGVRTDWHMLSHHGRDEQKIEELTRIEAAEFAVFNEFLTKLKGVKEAGGHLLDTPRSCLAPTATPPPQLAQPAHPAAGAATTNAAMIRKTTRRLPTSSPSPNAWAWRSINGNSTASTIQGLES